MKISRRYFLKTTGLTAVGIGISPALLTRSVMALTGKENQKKIFVLIIQRGAMDGLSLVVPTGDPFYLQSRPNIGLSKSGEQPLLKLDGNFGLNPALQTLKPLWDNKTLALIHQAGSPGTSRSHFDAQDFLETGTTGDKNIADGFLNRALIVEGQDRLPLKAVAMQPSMPRILQGPYPAISMNSIKDFNLKPGSANQNQVNGFESMYQDATDQVFRGVGKEVFESLHSVNSVQSQPGRDYPKSGVATRLHEIADLIKADLGMQIAVTDMGGWDTHVNQGNSKGQLSDRLKELSDALAAFAKDLGPKFSDVVVTTVTEFGRTVKENGTRGTDHGHGSVMMVLGGNVRGGKVLGQWKDLSTANLFEGRDLPVTTDSRDVFSEILYRHLNVKSLETVFPRHDLRESAWVNVLG